MIYIITLAVPLNKIKSQTREFRNLWEIFWKQTNQVPSLLLVKPLPLNLPSTLFKPDCFIDLGEWSLGLELEFYFAFGFLFVIFVQGYFFYLDQARFPWKLPPHHIWWGSLSLSPCSSKICFRLQNYLLCKMCASLFAPHHLYSHQFALDVLVPQLPILAQLHSWHFNSNKLSTNLYNTRNISMLTV